MNEIAILKKYNTRVPRYTSYPPANRFTGVINDSGFRELLTRSNEDGPSNIGIYIHIPFCPRICWYCGCNSSAFAGAATTQAYINSICNEIQITAGLLDSKRNLTQVHFGGGTPNSLQINMIREIMSAVRNNFTFAEAPEIAIECNPAYLDLEYLNGLLDLGFNRFSLGVQDFDTAVLKKVNRLPSLLPLNELIETIRVYDARNSVNLDFIYGLPGQSTAGFLKSIEQAVTLMPDRLVTFSYAHMPEIKSNQKAIKAGDLPKPEEKIEMFINSRRKLIESGYFPVGLDHYVLKTDELYLALEKGELHRNFQGYCTRNQTGQVYAFGITGITQLHNSYIQNTRDISLYIDNISNNMFAAERGVILDESLKMIKDVITEIMCNCRLDINYFLDRHDITYGDFKAVTGFNEDGLHDYIKDGLVDFSNMIISVSGEGRLILRNIASLFDPDLSKGNETYSGTI